MSLSNHMCQISNTCVTFGTREYCSLVKSSLFKSGRKEHGGFRYEVLDSYTRVHLASSRGQDQPFSERRMYLQVGKESPIYINMTNSVKLTPCKCLRVLPRQLYAGQQLWCVLIATPNGQVFTSSFFGLMHSLLRTSPKRKGHQQGIQRSYM